MFLSIGDKVKNSKYLLVRDVDKEKLIENEYPVLEIHENVCKSRKIWATICIGVIFFTFAWITMNTTFNFYRGSILSDTVNVEEQIAKITSNTANNTKTILAEVEQRSSTLKKHHELIAAQFIDVISKDLSERANVNIQNIRRLVDDTIQDIKNETDEFEERLSEGFNGFVDIATKEINKTQTAIASENDNDAIAKYSANATNAIREMLANTERVYSFYTTSLTSVLEKKLLHATDLISPLLQSQRRFIAAKTTDRINLCYNICTQNIKTARLLKSILDAMYAISETVDQINGLTPIRQADTADNLAGVDKSELAESMKLSRQTLDKLLDDDFSYLGSVVRNLAEEKHGAFKKSLLQNMTSAVQNLHTEFTNIVSNFKVIRNEQRRRLSEDFAKSVQKLIDNIAGMVGRSTKNAELESLIGIQSTLMQQFDNITAEVNTMFAAKVKNTSESLQNYIRYTLNKQLASSPTLSIQNFIPDDLCPVAMNYQSYIQFTLNAALRNQNPDVIDELFNLGEISTDEWIEIDGDSGQLEESVPADESIRIMVVSMDDGLPENQGEDVPNQSAEGSNEQVLPPELLNFLLKILGTKSMDNGAEYSESFEMEDLTK